MQHYENAVVRDYLLLRKIGEGGMGEVWLARDNNLDRDVAIKILSADLTTNQDLIARFRQEAKLQASLIHKNIVTLHTFFEEQGQYYMIMEYAPGITIKGLIQQHGPIPEESATHILNQIVDALSYAHNKGIIHRDIKPSNIMIDTDNHNFVKIMDFGIAKALGDRGLTKTGTRMGTIYYMSPEQVRAEKDIDQRSDIYSLGITLIEMLTGKLPFDTDTESDYAILHQIVTQDVSDSLLASAQISYALKNAIKTMTAKNKNRRYCNVTDILAQQPGKQDITNTESTEQIDTSTRETTNQSRPASNNQESESQTEISIEKYPNIPNPQENDLRTAAFIRSTTDKLVGVILIFVMGSIYIHTGPHGLPILSWLFWALLLLIVLPSVISRIGKLKVALDPVLWILSVLFVLWQFLILAVANP